MLLLPVTHVPNFRVFVGSGDSIECEAKCEKLPIHMQGHDFAVDTFVLDLKGADVVLGVQWMMGLGTIKTNYNHLTMEFVLNEVPIRLQGERLLKPGVVNNRTLKKMVAEDSVASFFHLRVVEKEAAPTTEANIPEIQQLLQRYSMVF